MKRATALLLTLLLITGLCACGKKGGQAESEPTVAVSSEESNIESGDVESEAETEPQSSETTESVESKKTSSEPKKTAVTPAPAKPLDPGPIMPPPSGTKITVVPAENYTFSHITMKHPEGFVETTNSGVKMLVHNTYPQITDNISFMEDAADDFSLYSKEVLDDTYCQRINNFTPVGFEKTTVSGNNAFIYKYKMNISGVAMDCFQLAIFGSDYTNIITFTAIEGSGYYSVFENCAKSVTAK